MKPQHPDLHYLNAMEPLAIQEIKRQLKFLPRDVVEEINISEAIAYTLNRLPPLYSTTQEGYYWQQQRAKETLMDLITKVASWGIRAARRPNKSFSHPLNRELAHHHFLERPESPPAKPQLVA